MPKVALTTKLCLGLDQGLVLDKNHKERTTQCAINNTYSLQSPIQAMPGKTIGFQQL